MPIRERADRQPAVQRSTGEHGTKPTFMDGVRRLTGTPNFGIVTSAILGRGALGMFMADKTPKQDPKTTPATPATPATTPQQETRTVKSPLGPGVTEKQTIEKGVVVKRELQEEKKK